VAILIALATIVISITYGSGSASGKLQIKEAIMVLVIGLFLAAVVGVFAVLPWTIYNG